MKILVTAFEPFNNESINPSMEVLNLLPEKIGDGQIIKKVLPTVAYESLAIIEDILEHDAIDYVLNIGQAGGADSIRIERVAININDFSIPDNKDNRYIDQSIFEDGQNAYFSNLGIKSLRDVLVENNIKAVVSNSAGTYVCNHVFYGVSYFRDKKYPELKNGFIHIPFIKSQIENKPNVAYMELDTIVQAIILVLSNISLQDDNLVAMGAIY